MSVNPDRNQGDRDISAGCFNDTAAIAVFLRNAFLKSKA